MNGDAEGVRLAKLDQVNTTRDDNRATRAHQSSGRALHRTATTLKARWFDDVSIETLDTEPGVVNEVKAANDATEVVSVTRGTSGQDGSSGDSGAGTDS